jgi:hypothetical protein
VQRHRLAADRVARSGVDVDGEHPAADGVLEAQIIGVDGVQSVDLRGDRVGHLVGVLLGPALGLLVDADVDVGVDQARQDDLAGRVDALGAVRNGDVRAQRRDPAVLDQDRACLERRALDGEDPPADDRHPSLARGRFQRHLPSAQPRAAPGWSGSHPK